MKRLVAIVALAGQVAILGTQLHCPMIGMMDHVDSAGGAVAAEHGHAHNAGATSRSDHDPVAAVDGQPDGSVADCVMMAGCLSSTADLAPGTRADTPVFALFDAPPMIASIESAVRPHTTPPPRHPVLFG